MCGICGQYNYKKKESIDKETIRIMNSTLVHRGPDDEGYFICKNIGLGFRRLSIIDIEGGHQPMSDVKDSIWIVFNGEIYNFIELKDELKGYGHVFRTKCDTEVIVYGYKQWGIDVLNHLNGMFSICIWDKRKEKLVLARDPMGIKPLYYKIHDGKIIFASEIRAILAGTNEKADVDADAVNMFLRYRYTPAPLTIFRGIHKLAAGTTLVAEKENYRIDRWYKYTPIPFSKEPDPYQATEELLSIYKRAVKRQLISDVPVGLLLSGGIDSGLLLGLMNIHGNGWPTFTVGYGKNYKDDELKDAAETASLFNSKHTNVYLDQKTFESSLPKIIGCLEEPVASASIVPMYFVCARAREDVTVALIGQGPDELFGGYTRHLGVRYGAYWRALPKFIRTALGRAILSRLHTESIIRGIHSLDTNGRLKRYQQIFSIMPGHEIEQLFLDGILSEGSSDQVLAYWNEIHFLSKRLDELGGFQFLEIRSSLPDELLMYGDKLSMAHSLEVRVPFLDKEIVEYAEKLSASYKIRYGSRKWLHRRVCSNFLPNDILKRKKRGFGVNVVDSWFRKSLDSKMKDYIVDPSSMIYKYLKTNQIKKLFSDHIAGKSNNHKILFSIVAFEEWLRQM